MQLILGSQSPRRQEILGFFNYPFTVSIPHFEETRISFAGDPCDYAKKLAEGKGASLAAEHPEAVILSADTIVFKEGKLFEKPSDDQEAHAMLEELNGSWHTVYTAVTATLGKKSITGCEETTIWFHPLSKEQIQRYHRAFHATDKAGGYAIQMGGSLIVKRMEGCFYNVMGLPINTLRIVLQAMEIDLWDHLS